jgi:hypothetical protein
MRRRRRKQIWIKNRTTLEGGTTRRYTAAIKLKEQQASVLILGLANQLLKHLPKRQTFGWLVLYFIPLHE